MKKSNYDKAMVEFKKSKEYYLFSEERLLHLTDALTFLMRQCLDDAKEITKLKKEIRNLKEKFVGNNDKNFVEFSKESFDKVIFSPKHINTVVKKGSD